MRIAESPQIHFSDYFGVDPSVVDAYGAFNISLVNDLPLFIDPFLLFNSPKDEYQALHDEIIRYLKFLRANAFKSRGQPGLISAWYTFPEFKQTWLGFSDVGNSGRGLGKDFSRALRRNLESIFAGFGDEVVTHGSHLEKLTLISGGVGKDKISDFATNLIKNYLLDYTATFARAHLEPSQTRTRTIPKVAFNYSTESWQPGQFVLPFVNGDFVVLTPKDMLTKDETWINKTDLVSQFDQVVDSLPNEQLRAQLNNYLTRILPEDAGAEERREAQSETIAHYPQYIDYFIRYKEDHGEAARSISNKRVAWSENVYVEQTRTLASYLHQYTNFYQVGGKTYAEAKARLEYLKDVVENKGGWRIFYQEGQPIRREKDLHILYRLTWFATPSDVSQEANDGMGPADFKVSIGSQDKTIVEFKLASNAQLKRNLANQAEIYMKASDAKSSLKAIFYFSQRELDRVTKILQELGLLGDPNIVLIDARSDNKPSGSRA